MNVEGKVSKIDVRLRAEAAGRTYLTIIFEGKQSHVQEFPSAAEALKFIASWTNGMAETIEKATVDQLLKGGRR